LAVKNSPELRKITGNILETLGKISNSTKWVWAHEKMDEEIKEKD
jgi:hypothetical protein